METCGGNLYNFVVADIRTKDAAEDIKKIAGVLEDNGVLILGSVDDVDEDNVSKQHSNTVLKDVFTRISLTNNEACYPHIYKETRNKHQFTISYFSVWRKIDSGSRGSASEETGVKTDDEARDAVEYYEHSGILTSYDIFHFGEGLLSVKNFPLRMSEVCLEACLKHKTNHDNALDAGSGPGRTAMELCQAFKQVRSY